MKFIPREQKFIDQMVSFCGKKTATQCAIDSGYGIPGARTRASELMTRADIRDEIDVRLEEIRKKWLITKDKHYQELGELRDSGDLKHGSKYGEYKLPNKILS